MIRKIVAVCLVSLASCTYTNDEITLTQPEQPEELVPAGYFTYTTYNGSNRLIALYNKFNPNDQINLILPASMDEMNKAFEAEGIQVGVDIPASIYSKAKAIDVVLASLEANGILMDTIEGYYHQPIEEVAFFNLGYEYTVGGTMNLIQAIGGLDEMKRVPYVGYDKFLSDTYELCGIINKPGIYAMETYSDGGFDVGDNMVLSCGYIDAAITEGYTAANFAVDFNPFDNPIPAGSFQLDRYFQAGDIIVTWLNLQAMDSVSRTITYSQCANMYDGRVLRLDYSGPYTYVKEFADTDGDGLNDDYEIVIDCTAGTLVYTDTDADGKPNLNDTDDDGDGRLTVNEHADPNGDGNPDDALDSDGDGKPDFLDADN